MTRDVEQGLFGGYLVLNLLGRPLEFHCTAPVRPNRAQEILYGPTLDPYLCGERIGQTLVGEVQGGTSAGADRLPGRHGGPLVRGDAHGAGARCRGCQ